MRNMAMLIANSILLKMISSIYILQPVLNIDMAHKKISYVRKLYISILLNHVLILYIKFEFKHFHRYISHEAFNPFQLSIVFHIETSHLFCRAKQMIGFYIKGISRLKWV